MIIIVDTGPLTHFAQAGLLDTLKTLLSPFAACVYPREVYDELVSGSVGGSPSNNDILRCDWLTMLGDPDPSITEETIRFKSILGGSGTRNLGEAACLAHARIREGIVYLDAIDDGLITALEARLVVQALLDTGYRLPSWALSSFD